MFIIISKGMIETKAYWDKHEKAKWLDVMADLLKSKEPSAWLYVREFTNQHYAANNLMQRT